MLKTQSDKFCEKSPSLTGSRIVVLDPLKFIWFCGIERENLNRLQTDRGSRLNQSPFEF